MSPRVESAFRSFLREGGTDPEEFWAQADPPPKLVSRRPDRGALRRDLRERKILSGASVQALAEIVAARNRARRDGLFRETLGLSEAEAVEMVREGREA